MIHLKIIKKIKNDDTLENNTLLAPWILQQDIVALIQSIARYSGLDFFIRIICAILF